jgi:hypothetical protein
MRVGDIEITKREVLVSISIIAILLMVGFGLSGSISEYVSDQNEIYNKAVKIESTDMFEYGMRTNVGNAFVYGVLEAVDTVTYPEIGGEYVYVEKVKERYTMHTRVVTYTSNGKTRTRTETYWTWDKVDSEEIIAKEISFAGVKFDINKIDLPSSDYIDTIKESSHIRYKYYGVGTKFTGTIFADLRDNTIPDGTEFYNNKDIDETIKLLEALDWTWVFWIFWIALIGFCVYGFYYFDNRWLE